MEKNIICKHIWEENMKKIQRNEKGSLLMLVLIGLIVVSVLGWAFMDNSRMSLSASGNNLRKSVSYEVADSALNLIALNIKKTIEQQNYLDIFQEDPTYNPILTDPNYGTPICPIDQFIQPPVTYPFNIHDHSSACLFANTFQKSCMTVRTTPYGCQYIASMHALEEGLSTINENFDVTLNLFRTDQINEDKRERRTLNQNFSVPSDLNLSGVAGWNTERRIYTVQVSARAKNELSATLLEGKVGIFSIPLFQNLIISEDFITITTGGASHATGRMHSNKGVRVGTIGGPTEFSPLSFANDNKAITTSGRIWQIFQLDMGGSTFDYRNNPVRVATEEITPPAPPNPGVYTWADFSNNLTNGTYPDPTTCGNSPLNPICWKDAGTDGLTYYSTEVNANSANFNGKIVAGTGDIRPSWYQQLVDNGYKPSEVLQPGVFSSPDPLLEAQKKFYSASIRIVKDAAGVPKSVDSHGAEITVGALSYDNLKNVKHIVSDTNRQFYDPIYGREANVIEVDISMLNAAMVSDPTHFGAIDHIYVGTLRSPQGEIHYPKPDCTGNTGSALHPAICMDNNGIDCTASCIAANTGSFDSVIIKNGATIPIKGLTITSNTKVMIQGDYNTVGDLKSTAVYGDTIQYLSKSWDASGWNPDNPTGPKAAAATTYRLASVGKILPLMENWGGATLNRTMSHLDLWGGQSNQFPPSVNNKAVVFNDWQLRAFGFFFGGATWITDQITNYGVTPPPHSDNKFVVYLLGKRVVE